jgi:hypothetical protein
LGTLIWPALKTRRRTKGRRLSKEKPEILTSIFECRAESPVETEHNPDKRVERASRGQQGQPDYPGLLARQDLPVRRVDRC